MSLSPTSAPRRQQPRHGSFHDVIMSSPEPQQIGQDSSIVEEPSQEPLLTTPAVGSQTKQTLHTTTPATGHPHSTQPENHFLAGHNLAQHKLHNLGRELNLTTRLNNLSRSQVVMSVCQESAPPHTLNDQDARDNGEEPVHTFKEQYILDTFIRTVNEETRLVPIPAGVDIPWCSCNAQCAYRQQLKKTFLKKMTKF